MIRELLAELEHGTAAVGIDTLARRLGTTPAGVEGALEVLVRKGRVVRGVAAGACDRCAARSTCDPLLGQAIRYFPVPAGAAVLPTFCWTDEPAATSSR